VGIIVASPDVASVGVVSTVAAGMPGVRSATAVVDVGRAVEPGEEPQAANPNARRKQAAM
jgi:hypothetical protein